MMRIVFFLLFISMSMTVLSQGTYTKEQRRRDSLKLDSLGSFWDLSGPNRVFADLAARPVPPVTDICFNKKFSYYANVNGKQTRGCFYINTKEGYVAMFLDNFEEGCKGMNNFSPGYNMIIMSNAGSSIHYSIDKRNNKSYIAEPTMNEIDRTRPTEFRYKNPTYTGFYREPFTDQHLPAVPYVINGIAASSTRYLFGPSFPSPIKLRNYLGAFGVGYFDEYSGHTYICLANETSNSFVRVEKIDDVAECFDGSKFIKEDREEMVRIEDKKLAEDRRSLEAREKDLRTSESPAAIVEQQIIDHEKLMLEKQEAANRFVESGTNLSDPKNKEAMRIFSAAGDVKDQVIKLRLEKQKAIYDLNYSLRDASKNYGPKSTQKLEARKECLTLAVQKLKQLELEMGLIDARNGTNYARAAMEKNLLYVKAIPGIDCK